MHDINRLAQNIRDFRCQRRMTQGELADKLFVTTQNVSKWERGKSAPDVENLCKLAAALQVSVDALLGYCVPSEEGKVLLAVDGGGTKTEFVLFTESGQVLERLTLGGSNPNSVGMEKTLETLSEGVEKMLAVRSDLAAFYAGVAGCTNLEHQRTIRTYMKKRFPGMGFDIQSDILNVMHSAECGEKCITVICGTGSIVYVRTGEGMHRLGGWGYLFDSAGSGYDLGRDAVCAALAQNDGIGPETRIKPLLEARLGGNVWAMVNRLYAMPKDQIAALSSIVLQAWDEGDAVAAQILQKNMDRLAFLINSAVEKYDCGEDVIFAGGLTARRDLLEKLLFPKIAPHLKPVFASLPQIYGACICCVRQFGQQKDGFEENFSISYQKKIGGEAHAENRNA